MPLVDSGLVGVGFAVFGATAAAVTSLSIRLGTNNGRTKDALVIVLLCNFFLLSPLAVITQYPTYGITLQSAFAFVAAGVTGTLLGRACYFGSISALGSSRAEPIKATQPIPATIVAIVALGESITSPHLIGILLIVIGVGLISWKSTDGDTPESQANAKRGILLAFGAAFFFGIEPIWAKVGLANTSVLIGLVVRIGAASLGFIGYLRFRNSLPSANRITSSNFRWYMVAGVANTLFLVSYYTALQVAPVTTVLPIIQTSPLLVVVLSLAFMPTKLENITIPLIVGSIIVVAGAILVTLHS